ncbi:MAG TPA: type I glutamate--ammonia ligase [Solirubrobacteraceae bacterium]|nr:type I glutamate--ammonia ligase [Solirubrobacteraceae bacterium]
MATTESEHTAMAAGATSPADVLEFASERGVEMVDLKFVDLPGTWQHMTLPIGAIDAGDFESGLGFDGSSIRGFQEIHESDMLLIPDPGTAFIDPYYTRATLSLICSVADPVLGEPYARDPRFVAHKAEQHLVASGIADVAYFGPEAEFFVFDHIAYEQVEQRAFYEVDSGEGFWNTGAPTSSKPNLAYKLRQKEGYFPVPPADSLANLRSEMVATMESLGIRCEFHHHEVSSGGQGEIDMRFQPLLRMADQMMIYKYVVKNAAHAAGKTATFMPKPIFQENGSGMHVHQSLWKDDDPLMYGADGYAHLSDLAKHYIAGLLTHAPALLAFCAPTTNSYRRLVPGYEAPVNLVYSARNRSACVRVPMYHEAPKSKRIEFRSPDPTANPYLAFSALMLAGLDGINRQLDPGDPLDADLYELPAERLAEIATVPSSLEESLDALEADNTFLLAGDVFTPGLIEAYVRYKREEEVDAIRMRPHPWEFALYHDA